MDELKETRISSDAVFDGALLHVRKDTVELPDGKHTVREYIRHPGAVALVAHAPDGGILLLNQFRYPLDRVFVELPAGKIDPGESPEETGLRELEEETGFRARELTYLTKIHPCIGYSDEVIYIFEAFGLSKGDKVPDEHEFLQVFSLPAEEAVRKITAGEITDVKTIIGILAATMRKDHHEPEK